MYPEAPDAWKSEVECLYYAYKEKSAVAQFSAQEAREEDITRAAARNSINPNDEEYNPNEGSTTRNLCLVTRRGTLVDFIDSFEEHILVSIAHRITVSQEHCAKGQYSRNSRPLSISRDMNFSENGPIENADKVQSEHWNKKQYTLFTSTASFLQTKAWNKTTCYLLIGDEVTVDG